MKTIIRTIEVLVCMLSLFASAVYVVNANWSGLVVWSGIAFTLAVRILMLEWKLK